MDQVLKKWEGIITRVAKGMIGKKLIVCGWAAKWWDDENSPGESRYILEIRRNGIDIA